MKKCFVMLTIFLAFALNSNSQDNTTLRFVKVNENKIEAALIFSAIDDTNFESMKSKLELDGSYSIEASYMSEKKIASFVFDILGKHSCRRGVKHLYVECIKVFKLARGFFNFYMIFYLVSFSN